MADKSAFARSQGSSPLTRGKLRHPRRPHRVHGLIPAHAGKTHGRSTRNPETPAHPRSRGENVLTAQYSPPTGGSSPLTRGKPRPCCSATHVARLIPAHAGKTRSTRERQDASSAHPRSRGENMATHKKNRITGGSSPLTRGKQQTTWSFLPPWRLIPAHAGKTASRSPLTRRRRAHPRSRGENFLSSHLLIIGDGSSPLTRGKPGLG